MFGIVENGICVDIEQLKKILINDWPEFYRYHYEQGKRGEALYTSILDDIANAADCLVDETIKVIQKRFGKPNARLDWFDKYQKSDIRSIGFQVLRFLQYFWSEPSEALTIDDIPVILEFFDTPPDKSLEAWDKWEKYWAKLDYPERRRKLLENAEK